MKPAKETLSWAEVQRTHRVRHGIHHRDNRVISLLTDLGQINTCYPDAHDASGTRIIYTGEGRRGDQALTPGNRAMLAAIESAHAIPLFLKLAPGRWQHTGFWRVLAAAHRFSREQARMLWQFTLVRESEE